MRLQSAQHCREIPEVKHVGLFSSLRRRRIAQRNGFDDVLFTNADATNAVAGIRPISAINGSSGWPSIPLSTSCASSTLTFPSSCCKENRSCQPTRYAYLRE